MAKKSPLEAMCFQNCLSIRQLSLAYHGSVGVLTNLQMIHLSDGHI